MMVSTPRQLEADPLSANCPSRVLLDHVTSKWGVLVLIALSRGTLRWAELRRRVEGVSEKMLSQTLKHLVADGLVWRRVEPTVPPQVTYGLTELGEGTAERLGGMFDWIRGNADTILDARGQAEA